MSRVSVAIRARPWWVEVRAKALEDRPEGLEDRAEALEDFKRSELPSSSEAIFKRSDLPSSSAANFKRSDLQAQRSYPSHAFHSWRKT